MEDLTNRAVTLLVAAGAITLMLGCTALDKTTDSFGPAKKIDLSKFFATYGRAVSPNEADSSPPEILLRVSKNLIETACPVVYADLSKTPDIADLDYLLNGVIPTPTPSTSCTFVPSPGMRVFSLSSVPTGFEVFAQGIDDSGIKRIDTILIETALCESTPPVRTIERPKYLHTEATLGWTTPWVNLARSNTLSCPDPNDMIGWILRIGARAVNFANVKSEWNSVTIQYSSPGFPEAVDLARGRSLKVVHLHPPQSSNECTICRINDAHGQWLPLPKYWSFQSHNLTDQDKLERKITRTEFKDRTETIWEIDLVDSGETYFINCWTTSPAPNSPLYPIYYKIGGVCPSLVFKPSGANCASFPVALGVVGTTYLIINNNYMPSAGDPPEAREKCNISWKDPPDLRGNATCVDYLMRGECP